jgi:penicillin amidase
MRKRNLEFIFPLLALIILVLAFSRQIFNAPPIGKLVDPFIGAIQNENEAGLNSPHLQMDGLGLAAPVNVFFDNRKVPHIFAKNADDLYFTQGYVTAYLRLWQMDFLTYVSAGRLSEIMTQVPLDYDRRQRRIGMLDAAKASLKMIEKEPETYKVLTAYTKGVNAYIAQLNYKKLPFEYKLLNYEPEPWTNLKTVLVMKQMANTLSGYEEDYLNTNLMLALGEEKFNKLFPGINPQITPIVHDSTKQNQSLAYNKKPDYLDFSFLSSTAVVTKSTYNPKLGSNSWVVSGKKTSSGHPILCCDPHLNLTLPSIWLEMQLSMPGTNVYGVSIPGVPAIIIGFNQHVAWGVTAGIDDVKDWYKLKLTDDYKKYELDGKWVNLDYTVEEIKRKGQKPFYDTIYHTIQGPIVCDRNFPNTQPELINHALRWELHKPSNDILTFIKLDRASNYTDYQDALRTYCSPNQNFTFACSNNDISVDHRGSMTVKWPGQGKFILDGSNSAHLYTAYIPSDSLPHQLNPSCNYIVSANQRPTDASYPYYYSGYYSEKRAERINIMLERENAFDITKMEAMQLDNTNAFAVESLPALLNSIDKSRLTAGEQKTLADLSSWKGNYDLNDEHAKLYELWWNNVRDYTWDEFKRYSFGLKTPDDYVLLNLIRKEPASEYFDNQSTTKKENANDIIYEAFVAANETFTKDKKEVGSKWSDYNKVNVVHMTNIGLFSRMNLPSSGNPEAINATASNFGPSWRMIVELGDRPKAFGVYPGGQSGNIGSASYDNFVNDWNKGKYYSLIFFLSADEASAQAKNSWNLN